MNAILHCGRCGSWAEFFTDGDGTVVEKLNHECTCPPRLEVPALRGRPTRAKKSHHKPKPARFCLNCSTLLTHPLAIRCPDCASERNRKTSLEKYRRQVGKLDAPPPQCAGCGCDLGNLRAKWCRPCRIKNDASLALQRLHRERDERRRLREVA